MLKPVFDFLANSTTTDKGLEYFYNSRKAVSIVRLANLKLNEVITYGFVFNEVKSISQKFKNEKNANELGCPMGMVHFLYSRPANDDYTLYVIHSDFNFILIEAKNVEMVDGIEYM